MKTILKLKASSQESACFSIIDSGYRLGLLITDRNTRSFNQ